MLFRLGGNAQIDADGYITGVPELIAEISASTVSYDLHSKKSAYERNGVNVNAILSNDMSVVLKTLQTGMAS